MDPKAAQPDIPVPPLEPIQPFLGNRILTLGSISLLVVFIGIALLYKTFVPSHITLLPPQPSKSPQNQQPPSSLTRIQAPIVVLGGYYKDAHTQKILATNSAELYNPMSRIWGFLTPMHVSRAAAAAVVFDNKIYIFGGEDTNLHAISSVEMFDPTTNTWTLKSLMPHGRSSAQALIIGNKIYVLGGWDTTQTDDTSMSIYSPTTDTWQNGPVIPIGDTQYLTSRCSVITTTIYCPGLGSHSYTLVFDTTTNEWQSLPTEQRLPTDNFTWVNINNAFYGFTQKSALYLYDPQIDGIHKVQNTFFDIKYQGVAVISFHKNLFLLGDKFAANPVAGVYTVDLTHPSSWQKMSQLHLARSDASFVVLSQDVAPTLTQTPKN